LTQASRWNRFSNRYGNIWTYIVGNSTNTITDSVASGLPWQTGIWRRFLQQQQAQRMAHAYLLGGPEGIGKYRFARALAALRFCREPAAGQPCGTCKACRLWQAGSHPDYLLVEPEKPGGALKIEQVREISAFVHTTASYAGSARVIVLSPAEALGAGAANALLKNLEEPPGDSLFLLISHVPGAVLATIRSRCQPVQMPVPDEVDALTWLLQELGTDDAGQAAALAPGRPLRALSLWQEGVPALYAELHAVERSLATRSCDIPATARELSKHDPGYVVQFVESSVSARIRELLPDDRVASRGWLDFYRDLVQMRQQLTGPGNPNVQLTLETLMFRWSEMLDSCH